MRDLKPEIQFSSWQIRKKELHTLQDRFVQNLVQSLTYWKRTHTVSATLMTSQCLKKTLKQRRLDLHTTHSQGGLEALNTMDPLDILAYQYDIVCNGVELSSGAVRNHDMQIMVKAFEIAGYDEEVLKEKFGALYNAFQFGAPPHAGMAPGIDRMIMLLRNEENIREIIPYPMSGTAQDLMCGAPNEVTEQQLREVHIKVRD